MSEVRLIDANALKKDILDLDLDNSPYWLVVKAIDDAPTVTPDMAQVLAYESGKASAERPTGKWIESKEHFYMNELCKEWTNFYCSECDVPSISPSNYCPQCGARMEAEDELD